MWALLSQPSRALAIGLGLAILPVAMWLVLVKGDDLGFISFVARLVHIGAAMLWIGMIWFVNFVQLAALGAADDGGRIALLRHVVPRVSAMFRHASHAVVASGVVLLATTGYVLDTWVFPSAVYIPTARGILVWLGVAGGVAMWALVHLVVWPNLKVVLDAENGPAARRARERVQLAARLNLLLAVPVTTLMVGAAHLY